MADGYTPIPRCSEGGISLVSAEYANLLIDMINAIGSGKVAPIANVGKMMLSGGQFILDLSAFDARLRFVEGAINGPAGNNTVSLANRVTILENRVNNPTIIANGSCTGNNIAINISLNI